MNGDAAMKDGGDSRGFEALSPSQRRAALAPPVDTCVMAGAGSGKTRVLTSRYVHLIRDHKFSPHEIAALTFTEKAAGEMRTRVAGAIQSALRDAEGEEREWLREARAQVEFAPIATIHSYCARLVRREALVAGVDPLFVVLDSAEAGVLLDEAVDQALGVFRANAPNDLLALNGLQLGAKAAVTAVIRALRNDGLHPDELNWIEPERDATSLLEELLVAVNDIELGGSQFTKTQGAKWPACRNQLSTLIKQLARNELSPTAFSRSDCTKWPGQVGSAGKFWKPHKEQLARLLGQIEDALWSDWGKSHLFEPLKRITTHAYDAYEALKRTRGALDFTDLEVRSLALLSRLAKRGHPLRGAPKVVMVDEYQDTSRLQATLLGFLRRGAAMFSVGDPKQSIYGFRKADVRVLLDEWEYVDEAARHVLDNSYRTSPELLDTLNGLGQALMTPNTAGVSFQALNAAGTFATPTREADDQSPVCELHFVVGGEQAETDRRRKAEANWIAGHIHKLVSGTDQLTKGTDAPRGIEYRDIAILVRARASLRSIEDALTQRAIPYLTQSSRGYYLADEIGDLIYALRVVHNPADRFALAALATSPSLAADDEAVNRWFGDGHGAAWERILADASLDASIAARWHAFARVQARAHTLSLAACLEAVIDALDLHTVSLTLIRGARRSANLHKAVALAAAMDEQGHHSVPEFLKRVANLRAQGETEHDAPIGGEGQDVVRLSTIHAAKGLEYPVVFIADVTRMTSARSPSVLLTPTGGLGVALSDPIEGVKRMPSGTRVLANKRSEAEQQELMRLFYVATTRAEERLYLSGQFSHRTQKGAPARSGPWGLMLDALAGEPPPGDEYDVRLGAGTMRVSVTELEPADSGASRATESASWPPAIPVALKKEAAREADEHMRRIEGHVAPLRRTRYVVSVSELLTFAKSPSEYYRHCVLGANSQSTLLNATDDSPDRYALPATGFVNEQHAGRALDERFATDVASKSGTSIPRDAIGRTLHAALEFVRPPFAKDAARALDCAVALEPYADAEVKAAVAPLLYRFLECPLAQELETALAGRGTPPQRELDLHARIRFPTVAGAEKTVAGFDSLLVKGSIDLWLPRKDGVWVLDYKTNTRSDRFPSPASLEAYYGWQLRLYALMAERVLGTDIAGAALVLLDPSWSREPVELPIDIDGERLRETRRLCEALARAELLQRYPPNWRSLVE